MKTLIELYDTTPIENVLARRCSGPQEMIRICPPDIEQNRQFRRSLRTYFEYRQCPVKLTFIPVSMVDAVRIERVLREVLESRPDCAIDISGGTDASLFAAGSVSSDIGVFTYSRKRNTFFEIKNAPFARSLPCTVRLDARSCFLMAGGTLLPGREDNDAAEGQAAADRKAVRNLHPIPPRLEPADQLHPEDFVLGAGRADRRGPRRRRREDRCERRRRACCGPGEGGLDPDLQMIEEGMRFRFPDETVRFWLRDIGAVLELQVYRACLAAQCFDDVVLSAVVNWQGGAIQRDSVTNEIDVMAVQGIQPVFISCKTCEIRTEALNELAILRDRFGGKGSRAIIATSGMATKNRAPMRNRAAQLGIEVSEWDDLRFDRLVARLKAGRCGIASSSMEDLFNPNK